MDHRQHFYERYTRAQSRFTSHEQTLDRVRAEHAMLQGVVAPYLPQDRTSRIVDLGCGYGAFLLMLSELGYSNLRGVDISPEQVKLAHELGANMVELGTLDDVLDAEHNVSLMTMFDVIEHLTRGEAINVLKKAHNSLVEGGLIIMRTPNIDAHLGSVLSFGDLTHEMHLNKYSALELFASLDFARVDVLPVEPIGGGMLARSLRTILQPFASVHSRISHLLQGISYSASISTPNMLIVARR